MIGDLMDVALLAIGVVLILSGLAAFRRTRTFIARCRTVDGRVTGYTEEESEEGIFYYPIIGFRDRAGEHELRGSTGLQEPPEVGAPVGITYDPASPSNAWVTGTAAPWVVPWFIVILGAAFVIGGFVVRASGG